MVVTKWLGWRLALGASKKYGRDQKRPFRVVLGTAFAGFPSADTRPTRQARVHLAEIPNVRNRTDVGE